MSPEERQLLTSLFDRVKTASQTPRDREAETLVEQSVRDQPYAPYYLAQAVIVQEKGLEAASERIKQLEDQVRQLQEAQAQAPAPQQQSGGFLSSIFGSSQPPAQRPASPAPAAPAASGPWGNSGSQQGYRQAPAYDGGYQGGGYQSGPQGGPQGGPWSGGGQPMQAAPSAGSSFLKGALGTAAGVAGGMLLANTLSSAFSSHTSALGLGSPFNETANPFGTPQAPVEETVINNYYGDDGAREANNKGTDNVDFGQDDNAGWQQASDDSDWNNDDSWSGSDDNNLDI
jgi:uncharacterized protein